jgi:Tol biopolymer transport system component
VLGLALAIGVGWLGVNAIRSTPSPADRPTPSPGILRTNGEVLTFTGDPRFSHRVPGDLVAVNPETGEERVLVEDLDTTVYSARWSADGRWVAYETEAADGNWGLWVVGASQEPRLIATGGKPDIFAATGLYSLWSPTGAELATISRSTLARSTVTGETTDLGKIVADRR